jgi:hypothetical protein
MIRNIVLLILSSFMSAQTIALIAEEKFVSDQKESMTDYVRSPQSAPHNSTNSISSVSYRWTIETNLGKKYASCWFDKISGDSLIFGQKLDNTTMKVIPLHLDSIKIVLYDARPRLLTGVVGGCLGFYVGVVLGANMSIALTDTYENIGFWVGGGVGGAIAGGWTLIQLFKKEYNLSALNTAEKQDHLKALILNE